MSYPLYQTNILLFTNQVAFFGFMPVGQNTTAPPPVGAGKLFWWGYGLHWDNHFPVDGHGSTDDPWSKQTQ